MKRSGSHDRNATSATFEQLHAAVAQSSQVDSQGSACRGGRSGARALLGEALEQSMTSKADTTVQLCGDSKVVRKVDDQVVCCGQQIQTAKTSHS